MRRDPARFLPGNVLINCRHADSMSERDLLLPRLRFPIGRNVQGLAHDCYAALDITIFQEIFREAPRIRIAGRL